MQNLYNLSDRKAEALLDHCTEKGIGFIPWFPVAAGELARPGGVLDEAAKKHDATIAQLALAWLFVILRTTHSMIHLGPNVIKARFLVYLASVMVLAAMWIGFFVDALAGSRLYAIHESLMAQL